MSVSTRAADDETGAVTAEAALVIPMLCLVAVGLSWVVSIGVAHARVVDAAREAARVVARGESTQAASALAGRVGPAGTRTVVSVAGGTVVATVTAPVPGPGGLFGFLPPMHVRAEAVAAREPGA